MRLPLRIFAITAAFAAFHFACATGEDLPDESAAVVVASDAGRPVGTIRPDASTNAAADGTDAAAPKSDAAVAASDAGAQADTAPPPQPMTPVCDATDPSYALSALGMVLSGNPPAPCVGGFCSGTGECCYDDKYCLTQ